MFTRIEEYKMEKTDIKKIKSEARRMLGERGVLLRLLYGIFLTAAFYMTVEIAESLLYYIAVGAFPDLSELDVLWYAVTVIFDIIGIIAVAPIFCGTYRMASRLALGERPNVTEVFYYLAPRRCGRAIVAYSLTAVPFWLYAFFTNILTSAVTSMIEEPILLTAANLASLVPLFVGALILLLPLTFFFSVFAAVINGEDQPIALCISAAVRAVRGKLWQTYLFRLSFVPLILLSMLTVGMLLVIFTVPYMLIAYFYYNAALFGKEPRAAISTEVTFDER